MPTENDRAATTGQSIQKGNLKLAPMEKPKPSRLGHSFPPFDQEAAEQVQHYLEHNHAEFHVFFNEKNFHNHLAHHLLAAFQLGAPARAYEPIYEHSLQDLDPKWKLNRKSQRKGTYEPVDAENWIQRLGDRDQYWPLLEFFDAEVRRLGIGPSLEQYIFSEMANKDGRDMLGRFVGGVVHPLIHCGYGCEFDLPGIVAEGLSMAAITSPRFGSLFPRGWHVDIGIDGVAGRLADSGLRTSQNSQQKDQIEASASQPRSGLSVFSICAVAFTDTRLAPGKLVRHSMQDKFAAVLEDPGLEVVTDYLNKWQVDLQDVADPDHVTRKGGWYEKWEELAWLNTLMLGATTPPGHEARHDFFLMHSHNAVLFLPSMLPLLSPTARSKLLHCLWRITFTTWIARGRPPFYIRDTLYKQSRIQRDPQKTVAIKDTEGHSLVSTKKRSPWVDILEAAANHGDEHAMKALRTQIYLATVLSATESGSLHLQPAIRKQLAALDESAHLFKGLERLDGTAFARTAAQLLNSQGWRHDGAFHWDFNGPGFPETWSPRAAEGRQ